MGHDVQAFLARVEATDWTDDLGDVPAQMRAFLEGDAFTIRANAGQGSLTRGTGVLWPFLLELAGWDALGERRASVSRALAFIAFGDTGAWVSGGIDPRTKAKHITGVPRKCYAAMRKSVPTLLAQLEDDSPVVREAAAHLLAFMRQDAKEVGRKLWLAIDGEDDPDALASMLMAAGLLGHYLESDAGADVLRTHLGSGDPMVAAHAAFALAALPGDHVDDAVIDQLRASFALEGGPPSWPHLLPRSPFRFWRLTSLYDRSPDAVAQLILDRLETDDYAKAKRFLLERLVPADAEPGSLSAGAVRAVRMIVQSPRSVEGTPRERGDADRLRTLIGLPRRWPVPWPERPLELKLGDPTKRALSQWWSDTGIDPAALATALADQLGPTEALDLAIEGRLFDGRYRKVRHGEAGVMAPFVLAASKVHGHLLMAALEARVETLRDEPQVLTTPAVQVPFRVGAVRLLELAIAIAQSTNLEPNPTLDILVEEVARGHWNVGSHVRIDPYLALLSPHRRTQVSLALLEVDREIFESPAFGPRHLHDLGPEPDPAVVDAVLTLVAQNVYQGGPREAFARMGPAVAPVFLPLIGKHPLALEALVDAGEVDPIIDRVLETSKAVRKRTLRALSKGSVEAMRPRLTELLRDKRKKAREVAVEILEALPATPGRAEIVAEALTHEKTKLRARLEALQ